MPVAGGNALINLLHASSPPADAPMPTIGKASGRPGDILFAAARAGIARRAGLDRNV
jgi:hypothetical protein